MKILKKLLHTFAVAYIPCLFLFPLFIDQTSVWWQTPYWWNLLVCFLMSFPFYLAFIEICFIVGRIADKKDQRKGEKILNIITAIIALGIILTAIKISSLIYVAFALSAVLAILWAAGGIIFKRKFAILDIFKQKNFWIYVLVTFIILTTASFFIGRSVDGKGKYDNVDGDISVPQEIADLEKSISKQWDELENFEFIRITVDTIDSSEHKKSIMNIKYSYTVDARVVVKDSSFEISYDDFLTLYNNNDGYVVYNSVIADSYSTLITDIEPATLAIIKNTIEWNWRTYQE